MYTTTPLHSKLSSWAEGVRHLIITMYTTPPLNRSWRAEGGKTLDYNNVHGTPLKSKLESWRSKTLDYNNVHNIPLRSKLKVMVYKAVTGSNVHTCQPVKELPGPLQTLCLQWLYSEHNLHSHFSMSRLQMQECLIVELQVMVSINNNQ